MAFTATNTTPSMGEWDIVDAYGTDISTSSELLATSTAHNYLIKSINFDMEDTDRWVKFFDGTTLVCGPVETKGRLFRQIYESPLIISGAFNVQTENDTKVHVTVCYRKFPTV